MDKTGEAMGSIEPTISFRIRIKAAEASISSDAFI
jgi:hypothetical protein